MEKINKIKKQIWMALFAISTLGVILMAIYHLGVYTQDTSKIDKASGEILTRTPSLERLYFWFYFTFISNMFAVVLSTAHFCKKVNWESKHWQRAKVMMAVNLLITFLVYWIILAKDANWHNGLSVVTNLFVHCFTPMLAIATFLVETEKDRTTKRNITALNTAIWNLLFPVVWLIMILIIYYATGAHGHSAIYAIITDFNHHPLTSALMIIGVGIAYPIITLGGGYLYARKFK